jgi:glycosyltransferase involved in cell wall biosynthesis
MFSRRVVEIPACGGIVMSAFGRGISETLGSNIANSNDMNDYRAWLYEWTSNPEGHLEEIWRQMRTIYRSHTTDSALAIVARTAGLSVRGLKPLNYVAYLPSTHHAAPDQRWAWIEGIVNQSVQPSQIVISDLSEDERQLLEERGVRARTQPVADSESSIKVFFPEQFARTFAEDVLLPLRFGEFSTIRMASSDSYEPGATVVTPIDNAKDDFDVVVTYSGKKGGEAIVTLPSQGESHESVIEVDENEETLKGKVVLVAGHDLKFAGAILDELEASECEVLIDIWDGHNQHDEERSSELLQKADIVVCEWGLGNAVWYSQNIRTDQSLIVRVHSQELFLPYLKKVNRASVDKFVFVGELIRKAAIESHNVPEDKAVVIPNFVDTEKLARPKAPEANKSIGFVGIVPRSKRLDRALDVLEGLLEKDPEFQLRIKGKTPEDYPWMKNRPEELEFYDAQYYRIDQINKIFPNSVIFDGFGNDMDEWYSKVGIVLSTSDFESFHLTIADGAASGAIPALLNWPGADLIYPNTWLSGTTQALVSTILEGSVDPDEARSFVHTSFNLEEQLCKFTAILMESMHDHAKA